MNVVLFLALKVYLYKQCQVKSSDDSTEVQNLSILNELFNCLQVKEDVVYIAGPVRYQVWHGWPTDNDSVNASF